MPRRLIILGSTGSIGTQALEVVAHINQLHARAQSPVSFEVVGLAARRNAGLLGEQAARFNVRHTALTESEPSSSPHHAFRGPGAAEELVRRTDCDLVLAAMVGSAGLPATLAAVELGRNVALANKETLVAAGALITAAASKSGSLLLPVDSEHAGLWQCLGGKHEGAAPPLACGPEVRRAVITASGGPFRTWSPERIARAAPAEALNHPTWRMGAKVTIDSASLMNKALEVIEARWLFGLAPAQIGVLVHPQSIVHAVVEFADGSFTAQLAAPDMRTPIQRALCHPHTIAGCTPSLSLESLSKLEFEEPDATRFPAVQLGHAALERAGTAGAILNAANEEAVAAFLSSPPSIPFPRIAELAAAALDEIPVRPLTVLADCFDAERAAREFVRARLGAPALAPR